MQGSCSYRQPPFSLVNDICTTFCIVENGKCCKCILCVWLRHQLNYWLSRYSYMNRAKLIMKNDLPPACILNCKSTWPGYWYVLYRFCTEEPEGMQPVQYFFDMQPWQHVHIKFSQPDPQALCALNINSYVAIATHIA